MTTELKQRLAKKQRMAMYKRNAKALYLLSDLNEAYEYLWNKEDMEYLTEAEVDSIINEINEECKDMTVGEIERLKKLF